MTLIELIYYFFYEHVFAYSDDFDMLSAIQYQVAPAGDGFGASVITLQDWLSITATIISITIIVILCCLFVYKIIKLIGGLIR